MSALINFYPYFLHLFPDLCETTSKFSVASGVEGLYISPKLIKQLHLHVHLNMIQYFKSRNSFGKFCVLRRGMPDWWCCLSALYRTRYASDKKLFVTRSNCLHFALHNNQLTAEGR